MQKKILYLLVLPLLIYFFGCDKEENATNLDYGFACCVLDQDGNDLLNPMNPDAIDTSQIQIYHIIDGKPVFYYNAMSSIPKGYSIHAPYDNIKYLNIIIPISSHIEYEDRSVTIVKWDEYDSDTITVQIEKMGSVQLGTKYWINGNEDIDWISQGLKVAKIVKTRK